MVSCFHILQTVLSKVNSINVCIYRSSQNKITDTWGITWGLSYRNSTSILMFLHLIFYHFVQLSQFLLPLKFFRCMFPSGLCLNLLSQRGTVNECQQYLTHSSLAQNSSYYIYSPLFFSKKYVLLIIFFNFLWSINTLLFSVSTTVWSPLPLCGITYNSKC